MKILIYREKIGIPDFPESFSGFAFDNHQIELITISDFDKKETIDLELSKLVRKGREENPDILVIPVFLGSPLSYYGVRLAMHWRVDESADNLNKIPIILLGDEDEASFYRHCGYSSFLKTPQVYYTQFNEYNLKELIESGSIKHSDFDINATLGHYNVKPPASYKSYHSVTNEWCILRWADALKIEDEKISSIRNTIGTSLYYKLLRFKYPISNIDDVKQKALHNKGKIMLIDDEIEKGWKSIFSRICHNQEFIPIGDNFKGMETPEEIVKYTMEKVKNEFPDVVILDLRLSDNDFSDNLSPTDLTGYKILEKIKEFNKGIQVIVISATSKIWNLLELQKIGADGFIMKESPDLSIDSLFTKNALENIYTKSDFLLSYSFLKEFYYEYSLIKEELLPRKSFNHHNPLPKEFVDEVLKWVELSILNICNNKNEISLTTSFLLFFSVIENISNRIIDIDNPISVNNSNNFYFEFRVSNQKLRFFYEETRGSGVFKKSQRKSEFPRNIQWGQKIFNTFDFISEYNIDEVEISKLIEIRNIIIHTNTTTGKGIKVTENDLKTLFNYIIKGLKKIV